MDMAALAISLDQCDGKLAFFVCVAPRLSLLPNQNKFLGSKNEHQIP